MADNVENFDDVVVKGAIDKNTPSTNNVITYTEKPTNRRGLDVNIVNPADLPGGDQNKGVVPCYSEKLRYDIDGSTVALTGSFADQYSYTGSGRLSGFIMEFDSKDVSVKLIIDSTDTVFEVSGENMETYSTNIEDNLGITWEPNKKTLKYYPRFPICFASKVQIQAKENSGSHDRVYYMVAIEKLT